MPNRELVHQIETQLLLALQAGATTAKTSAWFDTKDFDAATLNIHIGATIGSAVAYSVHESDDGSTDLGAAPATSVIDDAPTPAASTTIRVGYVGNHRYCNITVTPTGATDITVTGNRFYAAKKPTNNPI